MKRIVAATVIALILLVASVDVSSFGVKAEPGTITVPDDYSTIQAAINNANAGDTVFVRAGTYFQNDPDSIIINKPLSLIGEDPANTIIDQQPVPYHIATIQVNAANVTISGFTIKDYDTAIVIRYGSGETVLNCSIINNKILNGDNGILVQDGANFTIKNNVISGNRLSGIYLYPRAINGTIIENNLSGNGWRQVGDAGITFYGASNIVIAKNTLSFGYEGLGIHFSSLIYVYGNNITDNQDAGLFFGAYCNNVIVYQNDISQNAIGIRLNYFVPYGTDTIYHIEPGNMVYGNNFVDNSEQAEVFSYETIIPKNQVTAIVAWDNGKVGNFWSDYKSKYPDASEVDALGIGDTPYVIDANNTDRFPVFEALSFEPPEISVLSPTAQTYSGNSVLLNFTVGRLLDWIGYSVDDRQNVTISGNSTLSGLTSGLHNVTVYANDTYGNMGKSETITFTISEPFPVVPVAIISVAVIVLVSAGLLVYFKKRKH